MHTQFFAHPLQVVQIVSHGVGEVHKNIKVQRAFGWSKHLHIHQLLLSWQKGHAHLLRRHLRLLKLHVDFLLLGQEKIEVKLRLHTLSFETTAFDGMIGGEKRMMKTYSLHTPTALRCDYSCSTAAMGKYILMQVTTRAIKGLSEQEV